MKRPDWFKEMSENPVEYVCGICGKTKSDRVYHQLGICKHCERVIRAFVPSAAEKPASQISERDMNEIKHLFERGVSSKRINPVCRICGGKRQSWNEMSDPVNLICIDCFKKYIKTMLPKGRWALHKIKLLETEFKHLRDAYIEDTYGEDDRKKYQWFLDEYDGKLPAPEHMDKLVGQAQAKRIRKLDIQKRRELHEQNVQIAAERKEAERQAKIERQKNKTPQELEDQRIQYQLLKQYDWIMPSIAKLTEILGDEEQAKRIDLRDRKRRWFMYRKMTPEEQEEFRARREEIRQARGY